MLGGCISNKALELAEEGDLELCGTSGDNILRKQIFSTSSTLTTEIKLHSLFSALRVWSRLHSIPHSTKMHFGTDVCASSHTWSDSAGFGSESAVGSGFKSVGHDGRLGSGFREGLAFSSAVIKTARGELHCSNTHSTFSMKGP